MRCDAYDAMPGQPARVPPVYDGPLQERVELPHLQLPRGDRRLSADTGMYIRSTYVRVCCPTAALLLLVLASEWMHLFFFNDFFFCLGDGLKLFMCGRLAPCLLTVPSCSFSFLVVAAACSNSWKAGTSFARIVSNAAVSFCESFVLQQTHLFLKFLPANASLVCRPSSISVGQLSLHGFDLTPISRA